MINYLTQLDVSVRAQHGAPKNKRGSMSSIKPLAPSLCRQCKAEYSFIVTAEKIACRNCGYVLRKADGQPEKVMDAVPAKITQPRKPLVASYAITTRGEIDLWARAAFDTGQDMIRQGKFDEAVKAFYRAIDNQADFLDPHLWIAKIVDDPETRRKHLETVLAYDLNHPEATRELLILRGEISADALPDAYYDPQQVEVGGAVGTKTQNLRCQRCGSPGMTTDDLTGLIVCGSCNYVEKPKTAAAGIGMLNTALLKRRSQAVVWVVGERLLHCKSCGAERTIPANKLSERCPYCGSNHVIEKDALNTFQQPDGLIPFAITRQQSADLIKAKLDGWMSRMSSLFDNNKVSRATLEGVYLPFWMFDASVEIRRTTVVENPGMGYSRESTRRHAAQMGYQTEIVYDAVNDVGVCAVKSPAPLLTEKLGRYDLDTMQPYTPPLLASHPAQLYDIDFDKASLDARSKIGNEMRERHAVAAEKGKQVNLFPSVKNMTFQLVLMPVWVGTLYESDGDVRTALVNGQTGRIALGKPKKSKN